MLQLLVFSIRDLTHAASNLQAVRGEKTRCIMSFFFLPPPPLQKKKSKEKCDSIVARPTHGVLILIECEERKK